MATPYIVILKYKSFIPIVLETAPSVSSKYPHPIVQNGASISYVITHVTTYLYGFSNLIRPLKH